MSTTADAQRVWNNAGRLTGPLVEAYYGHRGLAVPETEKLRFAASLKHASGVSYPAIIARVDGVDGVMTGAQRTFLAYDGLGKAPVPKNEQRMSLGRIRGGMVRLVESVDGVPS
jgi:DNA primase